MGQKTATRPTEGNGGPGQGKTDYLNDTTAGGFRQLVKIALPWIAAIITSTRFTARKSCFLDQLLVMAEGGPDE